MVSRARWSLSPRGSDCRNTPGALMKNLSYRYKVPLTLSVVIIVAVTVVSAILGWQSYSDLRRDLVANAESLGSTLSRALAPVMLRDELWQAYEIVMTPLERDTRAVTDEKTITVVSADGRVYVSTHPTLFPTLAFLAEAEPLSASLIDTAAVQNRTGSNSAEGTGRESHRHRRSNPCRRWHTPWNGIAYLCRIALSATLYRDAQTGRAFDAAHPCDSASGRLVHRTAHYGAIVPSCNSNGPGK